MGTLAGSVHTATHRHDAQPATSGLAHRVAAVIELWPIRQLADQARFGTEGAIVAITYHPFTAKLYLNEHNAITLNPEGKVRAHALGARVGLVPRAFAASRRPCPCIARAVLL